MSILDTLSKVKQEGFDPKKDKIGGGDALPSGKYPVELEKATVQVTKAGRTQIMVTLKVVSGEYKGRVENVFLSFDQDLPEFVLDNNGKYLMKIAEFTGVEFKKKELESEETTAEALQRGIGKQFLMDLKVRENKKNPDFPYRNYDFKELEEEKEDSNATDDDEIDVDEDDLPF